MKLGKNAASGEFDPKDAPYLVADEIDPNDLANRESRAILMLLRSVNIGKLVGFVGSGLGELYGYPNWNGLVDICVSALRERINEYDRELGKDDSTMQEAKRLQACLEESGEDGKNLIGDAMHRLAACEAVLQHLNAAFPDKERPDWFEIKTGAEFGKKWRKYVRVDSPESEECEPDLGRLYQELERAEPRPLEGSASIIELRRNRVDPLWHLNQQLRLHRYITTNYDLEIEAMFEDGDFPYQRLSSSTEIGKRINTAHSRLGASAKSINLSTGNAGDLLATAAMPTSENYVVVHLHGSARVPESMVIFPGQYNSLYIDNHLEKAAFEDGREILFGGNAILYIAMGMTEEDLMRPLRYLRSRQPDAPIFALMPSLHSEASSKALVHHLKKQFGVNAIIYGRSLEAIPPTWRYLGVKHNLSEQVGDEFLALHDELNNIDRWIANKVSASKLLGLNGNACLAPRLQAIGLAEILGGKSVRKLLKKKSNGDALRSHLRALAIGKALVDVVDYVAEGTRSWSARLRDSLTMGQPYQVEGNYHVLKHGEDSGRFQNQYGAILEEVSGTRGVHIVRIPAGGGKGGLLNAMMRHWKTECTVISLSATWRGDVLLRHAQKSPSRILIVDYTDNLFDRDCDAPVSIECGHFLDWLSEIDTAPRSAPLSVVLVTSHATSGVLLTKYLGLNESPNPTLEEAIETRVREHRFNGIDPILLEHLPSDRDTSFKALFGELDRCRWLNRYLLAIVDRLEQASPDTFKADFQTFLRRCEFAISSRVSIIDDAHRQTEVCGQVLDLYKTFVHEIVQISGKGESLRVEAVFMHMVMKWMYVFAVPVKCDVLKEVPEVREALKEYRKNELDTDYLEKVVERLEEFGTVMRVVSGDTTAGGDGGFWGRRYMLHSKVRSILRHKQGVSFGSFSAGDWNAMSLSLALTPSGATLSAVDYHGMLVLYVRLIKGGLYRSAFALLRCRLALSRVLHMGALVGGGESESHGAITESLLAAHTRRLSRLLPRPADAGSAGSRESLGEEDRLWLFNEIGTCRLLQGNAHDAVMLYRLVTEHAKERGASWAGVHAALNLGLVLVDRGRFVDAQRQLAEVLQYLNKHGSCSDSPEFKQLTISRLCGECLAFWARGKLDLASRCIEEAGNLSVPEAPALRALVHALWATVLVAEGKKGEALAKLEIAGSASGASSRPDLTLAVSLLALELRCVRSESLDWDLASGVLSDLTDLERKSRRLGTEKLTIAILLVRGRIYLATSQLGLARSVVVEAISMSLRNGLRLKRLAGLTLMVAVLTVRGECDAARSLLNDVRWVANQMEFQRLIAELRELEGLLTQPDLIRRWAWGSLALRAWL